MTTIEQHDLIRGGWPHSAHGIPYLRDIEPGYALCACGLASDTAGTLTYRRRWLIEHRHLVASAARRRSS